MTVDAAVGPDVLRIDHIGSTAVPGLAAKDVVDLQVTVSALAVADRWPDAIGPFRRRAVRDDHVPPGRAPGPDWQKRYWSSREPAAHLHVREAGRANQRYPLVFRDYLRAHPDAAEAYAGAKRALAALSDDTGVYADAKDPVCDLIAQAAERWAVQTGWDEDGAAPVREPGRGRYAHLECEQRWLLRGPPGDVTDPRTICDRYVSGTRLRLRRVETPTGTVFKLGQKVRLDPGSPTMVSLTNLYLSQAEYDVLARLPATELRKTRRTATHDGRPMAVDEFDGPLSGLVLAEIELDDPRARAPAPPGAVADVTDDERYTGGSLAGAPPSAVAALLPRPISGRAGPW